MPVVPAKTPIACLLILLLACVTAPARAALTIEISGGVEGALPIAVVPFDISTLSGKPPADVAEIVAGDLNRSGVLEAMERSRLPATPHHSRQVQYDRWRAAGQDYLVVGACSRSRRATTRSSSSCSTCSSKGSCSASACRRARVTSARAPTRSVI